MKPVILQYSEVNKKAWDNFIYSSHMGSAHLLYDVIAIDRWPNDKNRSFAVWDDDKMEICLIAQLHIEWYNLAKLGGPGYYRLHSRWGFAYKDNLAPKEFKKLTKFYMDYIDSIIVEYNVHSFDIAFPALMPVNQPPLMRVNPGIYFGFAPGIRYSSIVDLKKDTLLEDCEYTTRASIRKIIQSNKYQIIEAEANENDFYVYHRLLEETYIRTGAAAAALTEEYNRNIFFKLIPQKISRVFFLRDIESNDIVATTCLLFFKNTAYYWWGGSVNERETGINKYLLFKCMEITKAEYARKYSSYWFETGGTYLYKRSGKLKGLTEYKKCFGTQLHTLFTGVYEKNFSSPI